MSEYNRFPGVQYLPQRIRPSGSDFRHPIGIGGKIIRTYAIWRRWRIIYDHDTFIHRREVRIYAGRNQFTWSRQDAPHTLDAPTRFRRVRSLLSARSPRTPTHP